MPGLKYSRQRESIINCLKGRKDHPTADMIYASVREEYPKINLIPVNPIKERSYRQPDDGAVHAFQKKLERNGLTVTVRREMGRDIDGACGQLRRKHMHKEQHTGQETGHVGQE